jgi:predicted nucleotide-binding protein
LALAEPGIECRAIINRTGGLELIDLQPSADRSFFKSPSFQGPFENWKKALEERSDLFLGYCSKSGGTADNIKTYLNGELKASVLDWEDGFRPAGTILEQIQDAARRCSGGIFLFTRDDIIDSGGEQAAPRDNVVFEAEYFAQAREQGAKMPADLGGDIYANLTDRANIASIKPVLKRFVEKYL